MSLPLKFLNSAPTSALPIDCFRIGVGVLSLFYFLRLIIDAPFFMGSDGLIDHSLLQNIYWYTWQPIFYPFMTTATTQMIFGAGLFFSAGLTLGFHSRWMAICLYILAVCTYRYQFLVFFVDDVIIHLLLFWCALLPVGKTLTLQDYLKDKNIMQSWKEKTVDGTVLNLFLYNIALIYLVAGISKYTSYLWLDGIALFAVLKLPLSWIASFNLIPFELPLKIGNYLALAIEPFFALIIFLKPWSRLKLSLGLGLLLFHAFIILTLDIPMANLGCLVLVPLLFRQEIMPNSLQQPLRQKYEVFPKIIAFLALIFLTSAMACSLTQGQWRNAKRISGKDVAAEVQISSADSGGAIQTFFYSGLWVMGLAQGYRLLDWIDERNFHQAVTVIEKKDNALIKFPRSSLVPDGMRGSLILTYLSGVTWMYVDPDRKEELRKSLSQRLVRRYCQKNKEEIQVEVWHTLTRIDSFKPKSGVSEILVSFVCRNSQPVIN